MRIAVIHHSHDFSNDYAAYLSHLLDETAAENDFVIKDYHSLLFSKETPGDENILLHIVIPATGNFSFRYWYRFKLPGILKKFKIDKVITQYSIGIASPVCQLLVLPDAALLTANKKMLPWQKFAAKRLQKSIATAHTVITYSQHAKKSLEGFTNIDTQKIFVLPYTVNELFRPMEWHDKLYIKSRFAENKEYFTSVLPDNDEKGFTELLKAFSKFKKWQQSSMQLLLLPKEDSFGNMIYDKLDTYKYRDDVKLINDANKKETADIIASAYALLHVATADADLLPVAAALQSAAPVISFFTESLDEYCAEAGIIIKEKGYETLGDRLSELYKDENLRSHLSEAALKISEKFQQKEQAVRLWQLINEKC
ncbi:MAG TPA: glycosyltransferase [Panacibacter sp.]|nr:glycosyltransferase [Panacibacter sp.]